MIEAIFWQNSVKWVPLAVIAVVFGQSGIDKILDWKGNLAWLEGHFRNSPLAKVVPLLLFILTGCEVASALLCMMAVATLAFGWGPDVARAAALLSNLTFLQLLLGQRVAKDYAGAASLTGYIVIAILALNANA
jgi:hypothetical protein